jgi:uncharacterized repeat protein (TIGR03803 family)
MIWGLALVNVALADDTTVLHNFTGVGDDGSYPYYGDLVIDTDGSGTMYGMTNSGSASGTIFKITPGGVFTTLHKFTGAANDDGALPYGSLILYGEFLYGVTNSGGDSTCSPPYGCGTIFKISKDALAGTSNDIITSFTNSREGVTMGRIQEAG